jgi:hypothetical protein
MGHLGSIEREPAEAEHHPEGYVYRAQVRRVDRTLR